MLKKAILLSLILIALISNVAYAVTWSYDFPITVIDTSGTGRTYYPVNLGFSSQSLIDADKIDADALNTNMQIGSTSIKYMMGSDRVMAVIPNLPASGNDKLDLYAGYSVDQTNFPIIVGSGGYITTTDDAALELGSAFAIEISGYFDTTVGADKDLVLKTGAIRVYISAADTLTVAVTGLAPISWAMTSGIHTVKVYTSAGNIVLNIDGSDDTSVAVGAGVPDTANNYIWDKTTVMPYIDYIKLSVGGVELIKYQPNTMVISTAVVNLDSGGSYGGVITWGTNSDISIHYGVAVGSGVSGSTPTPTGTPYAMKTSAMPSTWFANGENVANLPFYDAFSESATQVGMPVVVFYFWGIIGLAFGIFLAMVMLTRSALLGVFGFNIVLFIGSSMTVIPMWIPFVCLVIQIGIMYLYREVAY